MARNASSPRRSRSGCAPSGASKMVPAGSRVSAQQRLLNQYLEAQLCASGSGASKICSTQGRRSTILHSILFVLQLPSGTIDSVGASCLRRIRGRHQKAPKGGARRQEVPRLRCRGWVAAHEHTPNLPPQLPTCGLIFEQLPRLNPLLGQRPQQEGDCCRQHHQGYCDGCTQKAAGRESAGCVLYQSRPAQFGKSPCNVHGHRRQTDLSGMHGLVRPAAFPQHIRGRSAGAGGRRGHWAGAARAAVTNNCLPGRQGQSIFPSKTPGAAAGPLATAARGPGEQCGAHGAPLASPPPAPLLLGRCYR